MGPKSDDTGPCKRQKRKRWTAEQKAARRQSGVVQPDAKERWQPRDAGGGEQGSSPRPLEGAWHLDVRYLAVRTVRASIPVVCTFKFFVGV